MLTSQQRETVDRIAHSLPPSLQTAFLLRVSIRCRLAGTTLITDQRLQAIMQTALDETMGYAVQNREGVA
jgi:hypothetical protein